MSYLSPAKFRWVLLYWSHLSKMPRYKLWEFYSVKYHHIITSKLINQNWRMRIWDPRAYSLDSGGRLLNYRIVKQLSCPEHYLSNVHCKGQRWVIAALRGGAFLYKWKQAAIDSRKPHTTFGPADFAVLERLKRNSIS